MTEINLLYNYLINSTFDAKSLNTVLQSENSGEGIKMLSQDEDDKFFFTFMTVKILFYAERGLAEGTLYDMVSKFGQLNKLKWRDIRKSLSLYVEISADKFYLVNKYIKDYAYSMQIPRNIEINILHMLVNYYSDMFIKIIHKKESMKELSNKNVSELQTYSYEIIKLMLLAHDYEHLISYLRTPSILYYANLNNYGAVLVHAWTQIILYSQYTLRDAYNGMFDGDEEVMRYRFRNQYEDIKDIVLTICYRLGDVDFIYELVGDEEAKRFIDEKNQAITNLSQDNHSSYKMLMDIADLYYKKAIDLKNENKINKSIECFMEVDTLAQYIGRVDLKAACSVDYGDCLFMQGKYENAEIQYAIAQILYSSLGHIRNYVLSLFNKIKAQYKQKNLQTAYENIVMLYSEILRYNTPAPLANIKELFEKIDNELRNEMLEKNLNLHKKENKLLKEILDLDGLFNLNVIQINGEMLEIKYMLPIDSPFIVNASMRILSELEETKYIDEIKNYSAIENFTVQIRYDIDYVQQKPDIRLVNFYCSQKFDYLDYSLEVDNNGIISMYYEQKYDKSINITKVIDKSINNMFIRWLEEKEFLYNGVELNRCSAQEIIQYRLMLHNKFIPARRFFDYKSYIDKVLNSSKNNYVFVRVI